MIGVLCKQTFTQRERQTYQTRRVPQEKDHDAQFRRPQVLVRLFETNQRRARSARTQLMLAFKQVQVGAVGGDLFVEYLPLSRSQLKRGGTFLEHGEQVSRHPNSIRRKAALVPPVKHQ